MSDETTDPIAAIVREAMDYAADHGRITTPEDYADRIREALATPVAGEGPVIHIPDDAEYRDDGSVHWRVRLPVGAASGEGEAVRVPGAVERPCDCAGCHCMNVGDAEEVGYADGWNACRDAMLAALRTPATPVGEDLRERWVGRLTFHLADYVNGLAPTLRIGETDAQELLALLRTPSGEGEACPDCEGRGLIQRGLGSDCVVDCELCRTTGRAPGVAEYRRLMRELRDAEYELAARSEAPGEAELDEPAREVSEARWWASEGIRAARRGEGGGE